ncbi:MAG: heme-binding protein [SAR202 cluster bacterium]|nr:heme-binding protein [SAR202 cluster bacterium]
MYQKQMLSLKQCQDAINAMVADFNKNPNRRPVDMAIVDDMGNLLAYARMDKCIRPTFALRKAYTSAIRRMDTIAFAEQLKTTGRTVADFGDPQLVQLQGGLVINAKDGSLLGGIGVGGLPSGKDDEDIARAGLKALGVS